MITVIQRIDDHKTNAGLSQTRHLWPDLPKGSAAVHTNESNMPKPQVIFLISPQPVTAPSNDNAKTLPAAFKAQGWQVSIDRHRSLRREPQGLFVGATSLQDVDLVWPVGFGPRRGFLDWLQLLNDLPRRRMINAPASTVLQHGKAAWIEFAAKSHIADDPSTLIAAMAKEPGDWILKPLAGSFGQDVIRLRSGDESELLQIMGRRHGEYFVLQQFLPDIAKGETRTLVAGGEILGSYLRLPTNQLHANLAQQGSARRTALSESQQRIVRKIAADLLAQDIGFAAVDLVDTTLMEVNVANPGGFGTLNALYDRDFGPALVRAVSQFIQPPFPAA